MTTNKERTARAVLDQAHELLSAGRKEEALSLIAEGHESIPESSTEDAVSAIARYAFRAMALARPRGQRTEADCQALLGALLLCQMMGVSPEELDAAECGASLGKEIAELQANRPSLALLALSLSALKGCPAALPCPMCARLVARPEPTEWTACACGTRLRLFIYFHEAPDACWVPLYALAEYGLSEKEVST